MAPILRIGSVSIQPAVLAWVLALWLGVYVAEHAYRRHGPAPRDEVWNVTAITIVATVLFARLGYVAQHLSVYVNDWLQLFVLTPGTMSLLPGALFGSITALAYLQWRKIPLAPFLDALAPGALVAVAVIAFEQWSSGDAYGVPTSLPWAIFQWDEWRHPVQLYDAFAALVGSAIVWRLARRQPRRAGDLALIASAWYSAARVVIDAFRGDAALLPGGFRSIQVSALIVFLITLWLLLRPTPIQNASQG